MSFKKFTSALLAAAMVFSLVALSGCGSKAPDYSTWTYDQFASSDIDWDSDVKYQFTLREENNSSSYAGVYPGIMNLRSDGSAVMFEPSFACGEPVNQFEAIEGYENEKLLEIFYGHWSETDDTITISVKYTADMEPQVYTVEKNDTLMTFAATMAYPGGDVPVGSEMDCDGTIHYTSWRDYCAYAISDEFLDKVFE